MTVIAMTVISCGDGGSKKITPPKRPNIIRHDCRAGVFFIEWKDVNDHYQTDGIALYGSDGKLLTTFDNGILTHWSGNTGIIKHRTLTYSLFSFATLKTKFVGNSAYFIKQKNFIVSSEKLTYKFWNLDGDLIWEGSKIQIGYRENMDRGYWVLLISTTQSKPSLWLDLSTGNTSPYSGEKYPPM
jgi:hypothetical protein